LRQPEDEHDESLENIKRRRIQHEEDNGGEDVAVDDVEVSGEETPQEDRGQKRADGAEDPEERVSKIAKTGELSHIPPPSTQLPQSGTE